MTRIDQLKDPRYLRHPRLKDRPLGVLTHPQMIALCLRVGLEPTPTVIYCYMM